MKYTEKQIIIAKKHIETLRETLAKEQSLLDAMLTCEKIKQGLPIPINPTMRLLTSISWGILLLFIVLAFIFVVGQQEFGLWQNLILSQGAFSFMGVIIVVITSALTIFTYKLYK